jgi:protein phosphatase 2C family protein 2/3
MGVVKPKSTLPFVLDFVGTYSCHGVEPGMRAGETSAKINQDRGCVCHPFGENPAYTQSLFCVYDGHGALGDKVSHFVMNEVQAQLEAHPSLESAPEKALKEVFVAVDEKLRKDKSIDAELSGTTAVAVLYRVYHENKAKVHLWSACAGDSRAVMGSLKDGKEVAFDLTEDQKPDTPAEHARIKKAGGFVSPPEEEWGGPARVWLDANMTLPGLAMARSIGDHLVSSVGVCAEPEVKYTTWDTPETEAEDGPWFIVIASDGVWEFIESQQAVSLVGKFIKQQGDSTVAVTKLIETAAAKWRQEEGDYRDDITAIVIRVRKLYDQPSPDQA